MLFDDNPGLLRVRIGGLGLECSKDSVVISQIEKPLFLTEKCNAWVRRCSSRTALALAIISRKFWTIQDEMSSEPENGCNSS